MSRTGLEGRRVAVIGAGHQALVAAVRLARAGASVVVLEQGETPGGCVWTERTDDGVIVERGAWEHAGVRAMAESLGLGDHGLVQRDHPVTAGFLFGTGERRIFWPSLEETLAGWDHPQAEADATGYRTLAETAGALFGMLDAFPAPPTLTEVASALSPLRGGDALFRTLTSSAQTVVENHVQDPALRTALGLYASHAQVPVWAPGSGLFSLLLAGSHGGRPTRPEGGSAALVDALVHALEAAGGELRTGAEVVGLQSCTPEGARPPRRSAASARAVVTLADGSTLTVDSVVSSLDLARTATWVKDAAPATRAAAQGLHSGQFNVCELTVSVVTEAPVEIPGTAEDPEAVWFAIDRHDDLPRSFGHVLAGETPPRPWAMLGQVAQPADVAGGALWLSSVVPVRRADGPWTPTLERAAADRVLDHVSDVVGADLRAGARDVRVTGPSTWARRIGGDGNPNHLDNTLDQMLGWRPPARAAIRGELPWLHLCGAGTHPGGGLSGASGAGVADQMIAGAAPHRPRPGAALRSEVKGLTRAFAAYRSMRKGS